MHHSTSNKNRKTLAITGPAKSNVQNGLRMLVRKRGVCSELGVTLLLKVRSLRRILVSCKTSLVGLSCH